MTTFTKTFVAATKCIARAFLASLCIIAFAAVASLASWLLFRATIGQVIYLPFSSTFAPVFLLTLILVIVAPNLAEPFARQEKDA